MLFEIYNIKLLIEEFLIPFYSEIKNLLYALEVANSEEQGLIYVLRINVF